MESKIKNEKMKVLRQNAKIYLMREKFLESLMNRLMKMRSQSWDFVEKEKINDEEYDYLNEKLAELTRQVVWMWKNDTDLYYYYIGKIQDLKQKLEE